MNREQSYFTFKVLPSYYSADIFSFLDDTLYCDFVKAFPRLINLLDKHRELKLETIVGITQNLITDEGWNNFFQSLMTPLQSVWVEKALVGAFR